MDRRCVRIVFTAILMVLVARLIASAENRPTEIPVYQGDSLRGLFGTDWERVWKANQIAVVRQGKVVSNPDILPSGMTLLIPEGVHLTAEAVARIKGLEARYRSLLQELADVELALASDRSAVTLIRECRNVLTSEKHFVGDADWVQDQIVRLRAVAQTSSILSRAQLIPGPTRLPIWAYLPVAVAFLLLTTIAIRMRGRRLREAHAGFMEAKEAFGRASAAAFRSQL